MMPNNALSSTPVVGTFLPPRTTTRYSALAGMSDVSLGPIAIGNANEGVEYQLWEAYADESGSIWLEAPNTPAYIFLENVGAVWVALAFNQSGQIFLAWCTAEGAGSFYWFDSLTNSYTISTISGTVKRVFAALDDARPAQINQSDVLLCYEQNGTLYMQQQRDRYGVVYNLGSVPYSAALVQVGASSVNRFQFCFQNVQGGGVLPPAEYQLNAGGVINVPE